MQRFIFITFTYYTMTFIYFFCCWFVLDLCFVQNTSSRTAYLHQKGPLHNRTVSFRGRVMCCALTLQPCPGQHSSTADLIPLSNSQEEAAQERSRLSAQLRELQRVELTEFVCRRQEETNQGGLNLLDMTTKTSPDRNGYP